MRDHSELFDEGKVLIKSLNSYEITRGHLIDRLTAYEATRCYESCQQGDLEGLDWMIRNGCRGFQQMSDEELLGEWGDAEDGFMSCFEQGRLITGIDAGDHLYDQPRTPVAIL